MKKTVGLFLTAVILVSASHTENPTLVVPQSPLNDLNLSMEREDEIRIVERLIASTLTQIERERQLKELIVRFKKERDEFELGNQSKAHTGRMVRTARQVYERIASDHLEHLFSKEYLDELTFFSSIAGKTSVARP